MCFFYKIQTQATITGKSFDFTCTTQLAGQEAEDTAWGCLPISRKAQKYHQKPHIKQFQDRESSGHTHFRQIANYNISEQFEK